MPRIFLSHTHTDKPVVEPIALDLSAIFGRDSVFYDSWSIQPGDGIIDMMNRGLTAPDFVFYFVSANGLQSKMVDLEWQNALYKATKGTTKVIPVRVDGTPMPSILMQNVYIDLFTHGIAAAIRQIVNVCQGNNSYSPQHLGFSNLTYTQEIEEPNVVKLKISASHLLESDVGFLLLSKLPFPELDVMPNITGMISSSNGQMEFQQQLYNVWAFDPTGYTISPKRPLNVMVRRKTELPVGPFFLMHHESEERYKLVPLSPNRS